MSRPADTPRTRVLPLLLCLILPSGVCHALDVLVNQVGFEPNSPKVFRAQAAADVPSDGTYSIRRTSDNVEVGNGVLVRKGPLWNKWYWVGDFSSFNTPGDYVIAGTVGADTGTSYPFTIQDGVLLNQTGVLVYQYFWCQRCGNPNGHPGWLGGPGFGPCHMDDGIRRDNNQHHDAVGGWHDAGDYMKFPQVFAGNGLFALLWLYDANRAYYDAQPDAIADDGTFGANGIPDIIDECLHQARWLAKLVDTNGHVMKEVVIRRSGATFVRPEADSNNIIGDSDDRWVNPGDENTPQETVVCAALIKTHIILASRGMNTENFAAKALSIWNHRAALAIAEGGHNNLGEAAAHIFAGLDLFAVFGAAQAQDCYDRALRRVQEMADSINANPATYDSIVGAEGPGYEPGCLAWFARTYPATPPANAARLAVQAVMAHYMTMADDPIGLIRRDDSGTLVYFMAYPNNPTGAFTLGINRLHLLVAWAALQAYQTIGDPSYLRFGMDQYNWVMGANYNRVCMIHGAGDNNLRGYHHRYYKIPGHEDGSTIGVVPNGYTQDYNTGIPYIDMRQGTASLSLSYETNEGWLINNAAYAMALSEMSTVFGNGANQPPSVTLTNPTNGSAYLAGASVTLTATASDSDGTVAQVEFFAGGTSLGVSNASPYSVTVTAVAGTYVVTAVATDNAGATASSAPANVTVAAPRPPDNPANTVGGLDYAYYQGTWDVLPNFDTLTPASTGTVANFDLSPRTQNDNFGFKFTGYVQVPADGVYTFYTASDDGSKLYIGTTEVVNNDGLHGMLEMGGQIGLMAGKHAITVTFFERGGGEALEVRYEGGGIAKTLIPASALFRVSSGGGTNQPPTVSLASPAGQPFTAPATINLSAAASDADGTVANVDFILGTTLLGSDTSSPYAFPWTNVAAGTYMVAARATDNGGATATSSSVSITVNPGGGGTGADADGDGMPDAWEMQYFGNLSQTGSGDPDADGLTNLQEYNAGTNPILADTDGDGMKDGGEVTWGLNPLNGDQDANGVLDGLDDWNGNGVNNQTELAGGSNPGTPPVSGTTTGLTTAGMSPTSGAASVPAGGAAGSSGGGGGTCWVGQNRPVASAAPAWILGWLCALCGMAGWRTTRRRRTFLRV